MRNANIPWKVNEFIRAETLRVIDGSGKQIGVLKREEALAKAKEEGLDLVEIAPMAKPPVAKIVNLGKFVYSEEKKKRKELRKNKGGELKEIRFSPFIGEADFDTRIKRVKEFLEDKNKVKLVVVFKGRQLGSKKFGYEILAKVVKDLGDSVHMDSEPKFIGRYLGMTVSPTAKRTNK